MDDTTEQNVYCRVMSKLQPHGIWELGRNVQTVLKNHILRLPCGKVSETEERYPDSPVAMRAFLTKFFARHYLQIQNSLVKYLTSKDALHIIRSGNFRILDIGSGPAVASLAITDLLSCIVDCLCDVSKYVPNRAVRLDYILNDTSQYCLGASREIINTYYRMSDLRRCHVYQGYSLCVQNSFPNNINQLRRISTNLGPYDIGILSYVVSPLYVEGGYGELISGLLDVARLFGSSGRILILQDKYQGAIMRKIGKSLGTPVCKLESNQRIFPPRDSGDSYTYSYYTCLYKPEEKTKMRWAACG